MKIPKNSQSNNFIVVHAEKARITIEEGLEIIKFQTLNGDNIGLKNLKQNQGKIGVIRVDTDL